MLERDGWSVARARRGQTTYLTRPGGTTGHVHATLGNCGPGVFYPFTSGCAPFEQEEAYTPFGIKTMLDHGGDFTACAAALAKRYGMSQGTVQKPVPQGQDAQEAPDQPEPWEPPMALGRATEVLPAFPTEALPAWLRAFVEGLAAETATPVDLGATLALAVLATTCQRRIRIVVKPGWAEPLNLYTIVAMPPASRKSAVVDALVAPIAAYEATQNARLTLVQKEAESDLAVLEARLKEAQKNAAKGRGMEASLAQQDARDLARELAAFRVPPLLRLIANDVTPEALASLICKHGGRMAVLDAEGGFFDIIAGRYSNGAPNFEVVLKGHVGDTLRVDRGSRPAELVERPALTLGLAVQPDVLEGLAATRQFRGRGLIGRILFSIPPTLVGGRAFDTAPIPAAITARYHERITSLLAMPPADAPEILVPSTEALAHTKAMHNWLEPQLAEDGDLGSFADWAGKLNGAICRIAALLHMAMHGPEGTRHAIAGETMAGAVQIGRYFLPHAQAAFNLIGAEEGTEHARKVWRAIARMGIPTVTKRALWQNLRRSFSVDALDAPIGVLVRHGFLRPEPLTTHRGRGRKPSPMDEVNLLPCTQNTQNTQNTGGATFTPRDAAHSGYSGDSGDTPRSGESDTVSPAVRARAESVLAHARAVLATPTAMPATPRAIHDAFKARHPGPVESEEAIADAHATLDHLLALGNVALPHRIRVQFAHEAAAEAAAARIVQAEQGSRR